ncbi:hypothetical protein [Methanocella sp. MCL-LM]|uniref:hypothetical protein n=1 Tax=Methanocella sp. MCL-LM TaxID=3412035 RepID=UPI003C78C6FF
MIRDDCPCPKTDCRRHKNCVECREYHVAKDRVPYCDRPQPKNPISRLFKKAFRL